VSECAFDARSIGLGVATVNPHTGEAHARRRDKVTVIQTGRDIADAGLLALGKDA
jgi:hypothetical protein